MNAKREKMRVMGQFVRGMAVAVLGILVTAATVSAHGMDSIQLDRIERKLDRLIRLIESDPQGGNEWKEVESRVDLTCMASIIDAFSRFNDKLGAAKACRLPTESQLSGCRVVESFHDQACVNKIVDAFTKSPERTLAVEACRVHKYLCGY